jgi:pimeloyl-ACP methyl ester carboxylesterase
MDYQGTIIEESLENKDVLGRLKIISTRVEPVVAKHIVIFSHGFGVRRDDGGLLSEIAESLPEFESILFDYYQVDEANKTLTTCAFSDQVKRLNRVIEDARSANPGAIIDLIGHSQGTVVAALAKPAGVRKVIFLAPVFDLSLERTLSRYNNRPGAKINLNGESQLPILHGLTRFVPAKYWQERLMVKPIAEYNSFAEMTEIIAITANQDQLLPPVDLKELNPKIKLVALDGNHNFGDSAREPLIKAIREYLI